MNITLIGMPGVGKSTVARALAESLGYGIIDTDALIEKSEGRSLQKLLDEMGEDAFLFAESKAVLGLSGLQNSIISPGGSVVYIPKAMEFLREISTVVYLKAPMEVIEKRIDIQTRGIIGGGKRSLAQLFAERSILYAQYADMTLVVEGLNPDAIAGTIVDMLCPQLVI